jgi:hypothetical protein
VTCDCCGLVTVDEVALLAIEDAVIAFRDALLGKARKDSAAWDDAFAASDAAILAATGG